MALIEDRGPNQFRVKIRRKGYAPVSRTFLTKKDAEDWAIITESEMIRGAFVSRKEAEATTLHVALDRYKKEITPHKKSHVVEEIRIEKWKLHPISRRTMASLTSGDFAKYRDERLELKKSASTIRLELAIISHLFTIANKEWDFNVVNPIQNIRLPKLNNSRDRRFNDGEEERLIEAIKKCRNHYVMPAVIVASETGMRRSELTNLLWKNVNIKARTALLEDTKNGTNRTVPLSPTAIITLEAMPRSIDGRVFSSSPNSLSKAFAGACKRADIQNLHFHDMRHEATSRLANAFEMQMLMKVTGHQDAKMLLRYYHPKDEEIVAKLENALKNK